MIKAPEVRRAPRRKGRCRSTRADRECRARPLPWRPGRSSPNRATPAREAPSPAARIVRRGSPRPTSARTGADLEEEARGGGRMSAIEHQKPKHGSRQGAGVAARTKAAVAAPVQHDPRIARAPAMQSANVCPRQREATQAVRLEPERSVGPSTSSRNKLQARQNFRLARPCKKGERCKRGVADCCLDPCAGRACAPGARSSHPGRMPGRRRRSPRRLRATPSGHGLRISVSDPRRRVARRGSGSRGLSPCMPRPTGIRRGRHRPPFDVAIDDCKSGGDGRAPKAKTFLCPVRGRTAPRRPRHAGDRAQAGGNRLGARTRRFGAVGRAARRLRSGRIPRPGYPSDCCGPPNTGEHRQDAALSSSRTAARAAARRVGGPMTSAPTTRLRSTESEGWGHWSAQLPTEGFVQRTVGAAMRDRDEGRRARARRSAWIVALSLVLVAGAAYGWTERWAHRRARTDASDARIAAPERIEARVDDVTQAAASAVTATIARQPQHPPTTVSPPRARRGLASPASSASSGRRIEMPRCNCQEWFCDCVETP